MAEDGAAFLPNVVHVIPPGVALSVAAGRLRATPLLTDRAGVDLIDGLLRALAADRGPRAIGIIMSGTGTDGTAGLAALKEAGGLALVQDPNEAQHDGMPRNAMLTARPDHVLPVRDIPVVLTRYVTHDYVDAQPPAAATEAETETETETAGLPPLATFVDLLRSATGRDFHHYKPGTVQRRIERRMALHGVGSRAAYLALLRSTPAEAAALADDLLINVTGFFRDPDAFAFLAGALSPLLARHAEDQPLRAWVAGCSTGEEAYSVGILCLEQIAAARRRLGLQIFATDIDDEALRIARTGIYPDSIQADVSPARLQRFFLRDDHRLAVAKELRTATLFSRHDLLADPPFARLDLVSCRNLLIYLTPQAQRHVLARFHFALRDDGLLFLGSAELTGAAPELFEPVDAKLRLYRRHGRHRAARPGFALPGRGPGPTVADDLPSPPPPRAPSLPDLIQRLMLDTYAPAAVVTNRQFAPLYYFGPTDRYFRVVAGEPGQDILAMARTGLRPRLRELVGRAFRSKRRVASHRVWFQRDGRPIRASLEAWRLGDENNDLVVVTFADDPARPAETGPAETRPPPAGTQAETAEQVRLEQELTGTRRELNRTIRDLRHANEELKTRNEEAMSLNEGYLSTNEELESSKEELQSLNEELNTVNNQLRQSLEHRQQASADLATLLNSSPVATILLDAGLRIKAFNPRVQALFALIETDVGRPLADLLPKFADPDLAADADAARATGATAEREVRAESGAWYVRSVLPYRTEAGEIRGAVVTFADVTRLKQAELRAAAARLDAETVVDTIRAPLVVVDPELDIVSANSAFATAFGLGTAPLAGRALRDLPHPLFADPRLAGMLDRVGRQEPDTDRVELEVGPATDGYRLWSVTARRFAVPTREPAMILLTLEDVTNEQRIVRQQLQRLIDALPGTFLAVDGQRRIRFVSGRLEALFGYRAAELIGNPVDMLLPAEMRVRHAAQHAIFVAAPTVRRMGSGLDITGLTKDGQRIPLDIGLSPILTAEGPLVVAAIHDLRPQKQNEERLREAKLAADRANQAKSRFLAAASHDLRQPLQTIGLLLGVLQRRLADADSRDLLGKLDDTLADMTALLDTLVDISQIERGTISPRVTAFPVAPVLARARDEFGPLAAAKGLALHVMPSAARIRSDRRLLWRILANLLSNAIKYTDRGRILLGCRRHGETVRIEVWDTGIGIPPDSLDAVFQEFYRLDRPDQTPFGLGLGLYIVRRLAQLLGHDITVRSLPGKGTMFAVAVARGTPLAAPEQDKRALAADTAAPAILLVEDDAAQLHTLRALLELEGYRVVAARSGPEALARLGEPGAVPPDVLIVDYNLPGGMTGPQVVQRVRTELDRRSPALIVSGDRSAAAQQAIEASGHALLTKPVQAARLLAAVEGLVRTVRPEFRATRAPAPPPAMTTIPAAPPRSGLKLAVIEDDPGLRDAARTTLESAGYPVATFGSGEAFLADADRGQFACLVVDIALPGMDGLALQRRLSAERSAAPVIFVTGGNDLPLAVQAMRAGAADFLQKPVRDKELCASVARALEHGARSAADRTEQQDIARRVATLTARERQVLECLLRGEITRTIAAGLGISQRTAEHHRHNVMRKMAAPSLAMLVRMLTPRTAPAGQAEPVA